MFVNDMNVLISGTIYKSNLTNLMLHAKDAKLDSIHQRYLCELRIRVEDVGTEYLYDVEKNERRQNLNIADLCNGSTTSYDPQDISKMVHEYMSRIQPLAVDPRHCVQITHYIKLKLVELA